MVTGTDPQTSIDRYIMTPKEQRAYVSELRKLGTFEVRQQTDPVMQHDSHKRAMAVTELERRRQARAPETIRDPISGRTISLIFLIIIVAGAGAAYWRYFHAV